MDNNDILHRIRMLEIELRAKRYRIAEMRSQVRDMLIESRALDKRVEALRQ